MYPAAGVHRNATNEATSAGSPTLPNGVLSKTDLVTYQTAISMKDILHDNRKDT
jgi:hypothetical protein